MRRALRTGGRWAGLCVLTGLCVLPVLLPSLACGAVVSVDRSGWNEHSRIQLDVTDATVTLRWPMRPDAAHDSQPWGELVLNRTADLSREPLFRRMGVAAGAGKPFAAVLEHVTPVTYLTVGTRAGREREGGADWVVFFDRVHQRPYESFRVELRPERFAVSSTETRATLTIDGAQAGPFAGRFELTVYAGCDLVQAEVVLRTCRSTAGRAASG